MWGDPRGMLHTSLASEGVPKGKVLIITKPKSALQRSTLDEVKTNSDD